MEIATNLPDFTQDIYELVRAFFPGEDVRVTSSPREAKAPLMLTLAGMLPLRVPYTIALPQDIENEALYPTRILQKNALKRAVYASLSRLTGKELPWGALTGIRPVKLVTAAMAAGKSRAEIMEDLQKDYLVSPQKAALSLRVAENETRLLQKIHTENAYSLYVGIPFCPSRCLYCSFTSFPLSVWEDKTDAYLETLFAEMAYTATLMQGKRLQTVYIGGGTPTTLSPVQLDKLLSRIKTLFPMRDLLEMTVEAGRPDSITKEKLAVLRDHGIGRISVNPQTMQDKTLQLIGRKHTAKDIKNAYFLAREAGFDNINMDIILGLPGETAADAEKTLREIEALHPESLTVHALAIKRAARLHTMKEVYAQYRVRDAEAMVNLAEAAAGRMGLSPYYLYRQKNMAGNFENVGYALPEKACLYNILIMEEVQDILAVGAGGAGKRVYGNGQMERFENVKDVATYMARLEDMLQRKKKIFS